jgi:hypothetical protein
VVEAAGVHLGTEQGDAAVFPLIGLESLEDLLGVVQDQCRRVELKRLVLLYAGVHPPLAHFPLDQEHPVGKDLAEAELRLVGELGLLLGIVQR